MKSQASSAPFSVSDNTGFIQNKKRRIGHKSTGRAAAAVEENLVVARASPPGDSSDDEAIQRNWETKTKKQTPTTTRRGNSADTGSNVFHPRPPQQQPTQHLINKCGLCTT